MTTTTQPAIPIQGGQAQGTAQRRPLPTRSRRPGLIAAAVLLIVGCALTGALLVSRAGDTSEVLVATRPVPAGHVIGAGDVGVTRVAGSVRAIDAGDSATVIGRTAAVGLVAGQVLNRDMVAAAAVPAANQAMIGVALRPGQFPADGLAIGDRVLAVQIPAANDPAANAAKALTTAEVYGLRTDPTSSTDTLVTLLLPLDQANRVMTQAAVGRIGLVKVAAGS
ncbi:MAG: SAF domain-containing protein [Sporichthyaceae bacterium]